MLQPIDELLVKERIRSLLGSGQRSDRPAEEREREEDGPAARLPLGDLLVIRPLTSLGDLR